MFLPRAVRQNVSPSDASENNEVTSDVAIEVGKDSRQMDISQVNGLNLDEPVDHNKRLQIINLSSSYLFHLEYLNSCVLTGGGLKTCWNILKMLI